MAEVARLKNIGGDSLLNEARLEQVARLLAWSEQDDYCDGWLSADVAEQLLLADSPADRHGEWRELVALLAERYPKLDVLLAESPEYPEILLRTGRAPAFLFVRGSLNGVGDKAIAIVGSRNASERATRAAREIAGLLADNGITIVSGLARGVDTAAHSGALDANGHTTAVVGTGIDVVFPPENRDLVERIVQTGAVVSQFPPGLPPSKTSFPLRNAVIAGLARISLIVEAEEFSGTRIEMDYALEFGRQVLLWAPGVGRCSWARALAAASDDVHLVCSTSEVRELAGQH
ncbi:MAG: DNA-protecting protein DprA [Chloroflexi bacterium]|nr:DNA-protecting protein DprA [Chloroflexota bacterium]